MHEQQIAYQLSPPTYACTPFSSGYDYFVQEPASLFQQIPQIYAEPSLHGDYMHSLSTTYPPMTYPEGIKQDAYFTDDDFLNPFGISYASLSGLEAPSQQIHPGVLRVNNSFSYQYPRSR